MLTLRSAFVLALLLLALPVPAAEVGGVVRVVDGDSLRIGQVDVRLFGIDAPERGQTCERDGKPWACGDWAAEALAALVRGRSVSCERLGTDRYGRMLGACRADGQDLNAALVRQGAAFAYRRYSTAYVVEERAARAAGRGIWAGTAEPPEAYRRRIETAATADGDCRIKGNISAGGRIYHLPGQAHYDATRVDTRAGERWFCTEAEARAAGWRAARR